jgi:AraC-like DNA-binding protein
MTQFNEFPRDSLGTPRFTSPGLSHPDVLRRVALADGLVAKRSARLSLNEHFRFWEGLQADTNDPLLPVHSVDTLIRRAWAPAYYAALCCSNLRVASGRVARYKRLVSPLVLDVAELDEILRIRFEWPGAAGTPPASLVLAEQAFIVRIARAGTRERVRPCRVVLPRPPRSAVAVEDYFGVAVESGVEAILEFSLGDAIRPFSLPSDSSWASFAPRPLPQLEELEDDASVQERVSAVLLHALPSAQFQMVDVAKRLATSRRTLQRRLCSENTTFQRVLCRVREALARHYLARTSLTCAEIAFLLGFEDPNSFFRAFHDWTGHTPERMRATLTSCPPLA